MVDGRIDRQALAGIVFRNGAALAELELLTHPAIARLLGEEVAGVDAPVIVVEMPLPMDRSGRGGAGWWWTPPTRCDWPGWRLGG